ncbi:IS4 family transposase [Desulfonatronovibrio magnus]|uniref:IS4 family transposase n=1 Tax=Desulfonatronovibrio magnus TaxID=698827 RepID=UPI000A04FE86
MKQPYELGEAVRLVARLGGYLGRKNDLPPGHQVIWEGYQVLQHMCFGVALFDYGELQRNSYG